MEPTPPTGAQAVFPQNPCLIGLLCAVPGYGTLRRDEGVPRLRGGRLSVANRQWAVDSCQPTLRATNQQQLKSISG